MAIWRVTALGANMPFVVGVAVRVHSRYGDDLGVAYVPHPLEVGDVLELGHGELLLLRIVDLVEARPHSPLAALGVARADGRALDGQTCGSRSASSSLAG